MRAGHTTIPWIFLPANYLFVFRKLQDTGENPAQTYDEHLLKTVFDILQRRKTLDARLRSLYRMLLDESTKIWLAQLARLFQENIKFQRWQFFYRRSPAWLIFRTNLFIVSPFVKESKPLLPNTPLMFERLIC